MNAEIETYQDQLLTITQDAPGIVVGLSDERFNARPAPNRWSIAECFDHLNTSARLFLPVLEGAIEDARTRGLTSAGPFAYPLLERLFLSTTEPPPRMRWRTPPTLAPSAAHRPAGDVLREFQEWQAQFGERIRRADGVDLRRVRVRSPALRWLTYSLGTAIAVMLAHERRHLWQARQTRNELDRVGGVVSGDR